MDWLLQTVAPRSADAADIYSIVLERIGPEDHLKLATFVSASDGTTHDCILAVVSNVNDDAEQAVLLLTSARRPARIVAVMPVVESLEARIAQVAVPSTSRKSGDSALQQTVNALNLTLTLGQEQGLAVSSAAVQDVKDIVAEVRRLQAIAKECNLRYPSDLGAWADRYAVVGRGSTAEVGEGAEESLSRILASPSPASPTINRGPKSPKPSQLPLAPDVSDWRQNWMSERLRGREEEFIRTDRIRVRVATWNVYAKVPSGSLQNWLRPEGQPPSDLYVIGLQEIDDDRQAYVRYQPYRENLWCEIVQKTLEATGEHVVKVASQQLIGLLIIVFASASASTCVRDVSTSYVGTGTWGIGNKGATTVRLRYNDTYLTFVNSHLAAFHEQALARNRDFAEIVKRLVYPVSTRQTTPRLVPPVGGGASTRLSAIYQTGHLIWLGDLNYRVDLPNEEARQLVADKKFEALCEKDQLREHMTAGRVFHDFQEGSIAFAPTYKYDVGTSEFDSSEKLRIPAYTDRILYLPARLNDITCLEYNSYPEFVLSDHKPVGATLSVAVCSYLPDEKSKIEAELLRELDALENEAVPDVQIEPGSLDFEATATTEIIPGRTIVLRNDRKKPAKWRLIPKPNTDEDRVCEDWLKVSQKEGTLQPGESTEVHFALDVTAVALTDSLADVLIISVVGGRDIFLPLNVAVVAAPEQAPGPATD